MFTLSEASEDTKKLLRYAIIIIGVLVFCFIAIKIILIVKDIIFPPAPPKAVASYGQLPQQSFPKNVSDQSFSYTVNTLTGALPSFSTVANVYKVKIEQPDLLAVKKFEEKAVSAGFTKGSQALTDNIFQWNNKTYGQDLQKSIKYNILTKNFEISSDYLANPDISSGKNLPKKEDAVKLANDMLKNMKLIMDDIDETKTSTNLLSIRDGSLIPATSLSNSQIIRVDYFQKDLNKLPVFYEKPNSSNISIFIAGGGYKGQIVAANYIYQTASTDFSTYNIKTANQALEELKQGLGYIASYDGSSNNISIQDVKLAYYISSQPQDFIMPIFVFNGNDNFTAYVPAIMDEWISK